MAFEDEVVAAYSVLPRLFVKLDAVTYGGKVCTLHNHTVRFVSYGPPLHFYRGTMSIYMKLPPPTSGLEKTDLPW